MSGSFVDANEADKANTIAVGPALVADALARNAERQVESGRFIQEHGAAVLNGHSVVDTVPDSIGQE